MLAATRPESRTEADTLSEKYDAVVIGSGPAGEVAVSRLNQRGLRVALAERELVGGECAYWACIPSKTLLRPPEARSEARRAAGVDEPAQRWPEVAKYRDYMIRGLDDARQVTSYRDSGVDVYKAEARITRPGQVRVDGQTLDTQRIVIATGSDAKLPPLPGLDEAGYWTNRQATTLSELPASVVVLGGGPVGIELGQMLCRFGAEVTIVQAADRLLDREDARVGELIAQALRDEGVDVRLGAQATRVAREDGARVVTLDDGQRVAGQELLVATGRAPRVAGIGLENVGIDPSARGIEVDERCRAGEGIWAIGDVTGLMPFTHVGMYQGRIAAGDIAGDSVRADYSVVPRVVFSDPEIAGVGLTEQQAHDQGLDLATCRINLADAIARPWTYETEPRGELGLLADVRRQVLVRAWAFGP